MELCELLNSLQTEVFFYLKDGPVKDALIARYLDEEGAHPDILEFELDASLRIKRAPDSCAIAIECRLEADDFLYQSCFAVADFTAEETTELIEHLRTYAPLPPQLPRNKETLPTKHIIRKKKNAHLLNISAAATTLGISQRLLKALIPCSDIRIAENNGEKSIEEYFWDKELIARLATLTIQYQQGGRYTVADATFIAAHCCAGDIKWARDIIAEFLRYRPELDR